MTDQEQKQEQTRKQEFKHRIDKLYAETAQEREHFKEAFEHFKPNDLEDGRKWLSRGHYLANLQSLKEFADRNYKGEKPRLVISTPHKKVVAEGEVEEVFFRLTDPKYNQNALDNLKNCSILPEDSKLSDYAFLFPLINEGKQRPKNYYTSEESDKKLYAESDRECRLCILYNIMELKEGYDINDPNRRTQFTEAFERFTELFEKKFDDPKPANIISFFNILIPHYICIERASAIKRKDHSKGDLDLTDDDIIKQYETLDDKTNGDILSMLPLIASRYIKAIDHGISENRKILKKMVDLGIIKRHGELTAEFKLYLEGYLKDQFLTYYSKDQDIKSISELGQSDDSNTDYLNTRKLMILLAIFIGMPHTEIMKVCYSEDRHRQDKAFDLEQMALIVKECLRLKKA